MENRKQYKGSGAVEAGSTGAKKINHNKNKARENIPLKILKPKLCQTYLALALDGGPELAELREVDALVAVL